MRLRCRTNILCVASAKTTNAGRVLNLLGTPLTSLHDDKPLLLAVGGRRCVVAVRVRLIGCKCLDRDASCKLDLDSWHMVGRERRV